MNQNKQETLVKEWMIETLPYEIMWMNKAGKIVYANTKFCNRLGYKKSEITKLSIFDINSTATAESWEKHWGIVKKDKVHSFKGTHVNKSGKFYEVEIFAQYFSNNGKNLICAVVNDISQSSFYKNLMESTETFAHVGGWKLNLQDGSLIATAEAMNIFNSNDKDDLLPGNVIHYFTESENVKKLLKGVMRNAASFYKIVGVYQDVTEQQIKENTLQLYKEVIDNAEDLIYVYNRDGDLLYYSDSLLKQLGFTRKQLDNSNIFDLDPSMSSKFWTSHIDEIASKGSVRFEWLVVRKDGTKFPADITANHIRYNDEDLNCAVVRDITERKKRDLKLYEALEEIKSLKNRLENENEYLQEEISSKLNYKNIICKSDSYEKVLQQVNQVAPTDTSVLITGESGTGKELLANALHVNSLRKDRPLIKVNCATLPKELIESELFGHKKGAFTGATENKVGKFTLADGGTIFLDEIGEMPIDLQSKLLRVLQEGEFDELGGTKTIKVDVRVIAATNRHLKNMIQDGAFREDLYYRLNVFPIHNIPLRARKEDIPLLAQFFLEKYSAKAGKAFKRLSKKTIEVLMNYNFPGNIRELENLIERAVIVESGTTLNPGSWMPKTDILNGVDDFKSFEALQRDYIIEVLNHTDWRVSGKKGAATILNMKDKTLFAKMKRLGIEKQVILKR